MCLGRLQGEGERAEGARGVRCARTYTKHRQRQTLTAPQGDEQQVDDRQEDGEDDRSVDPLELLLSVD